MRRSGLAMMTFGLLLWGLLGAGQAWALQLSEARARAIGERIWHNEGAGKIENLTVWNRGEDFPSFGIGHFIWYPAGVEGPFTESFPQLLEYLQRSTELPAWLNRTPDAPWPDRQTFYAAIDSPEMQQLRRLLQQTMAQQTAFIIQRLEAALPRMLAGLATAQERQRVERRFYAVAQQANGLYALIDYVNFKGEGISAQERYRGQGWGLLQVLQAMADDAAPLPAFVEAADRVLTRRVDNAPRDESRWLPGWRKRLQTYLRP